VKGEVNRNVVCILSNDDIVADSYQSYCPVFNLCVAIHIFGMPDFKFG